MHYESLAEKSRMSRPGSRHRLIAFPKINLSMFKKSSYYSALVSFNGLQPLHKEFDVSNRRSKDKFKRWLRSHVGRAG